MKKFGLIVAAIIGAIIVIQVAIYFLSLQSKNQELSVSTPVHQNKSSVQAVTIAEDVISSEPVVEQSAPQKAEDKPIYEGPSRETILLY